VATTEKVAVPPMILVCYCGWFVMTGCARTAASPKCKARSVTAAMDQVADPSAVDLDALFEDQWRSSLLALALGRLSDKFSLKQIQIFDLIVIKEWPAGEVAEALGVTLANVYVTKHRVAAAVKREVAHLAETMEKR